ncbi:MAG: N-acetylmuramic acid 6-phosphate etherase [Candidatus Eremiobacteraeota bacterium]|nr:N-acetylmuramic acid 6-phosphate etherase [Candidatus Eremiobacteraeota bacterium]
MTIPPTEARNTRGAGLDLLGTPGLVELLVAEQRGAVDAVLNATDVIAQAVEAIVQRLVRGGALHYVGAGSSGRIAMLDAAEMPPTFGTSRELVRAHIAGGMAALEHAIEGAEDDAAAGEAATRANVQRGDAVIGISASGSAAFVIAAITCARSLGAYTAALTSVAESPLAHAGETSIVLPTGSELLAGSTRLKAGTAQKIALNAISTAVMVRLGKVYDNLMVDVVASNRKLRARALRLVQEIAAVDEARARELLERAGGRVKLAVVMQRNGLDAAAAQSLLERHGGALRALI